MKKTILDKLHSTQIEILDEIIRICDKHNIIYFLCGGALLGAIESFGGRGLVCLDVGYAMKFFKALKTNGMFGEVEFKFLSYYSRGCANRAERAVVELSFIDGFAKGVFYLDPNMNNRRKLSYNKAVSVKLLAPVVLKEQYLLSCVDSLITTVFKSGVYKPFTNMYPTHASFLNDDLYAKWVGSCLCLVQLCCGSRSRGVIGVNTYHKPTSGEIAGVKGSVFDADDSYIMTVKNLTKRRNENESCAKIHKMTSGSTDTSEKLNVESWNSAVADVRDNNSSVVRPFMAHFLVFSDKTRSPFDSFLDLVRAVRYCLASDHRKNTVWASVGGTMMVKQANDDYFRVVRAYMKGVIRKVFTHTRGKKSTHELRRIYACYAYEIFSLPDSKEVAFTQKVLGHASMGVSLGYTDLKIDCIDQKCSK